MQDWRSDAAHGRLQVGSSVRFSRTFTAKDVQAFGELSHDYNPVHYDPAFAATKGFRGLICHGLLVSSMVTEVGGQWAWLATGLEFKFRLPVYVGETIHCEVTLRQLNSHGWARAEAVLTNEAGEIVQQGTLHGLLPQGADRERLQAMLAEGDPTNRSSR
jgi:3-hydroxybutyryl-CoA dehydratase